MVTPVWEACHLCAAVLPPPSRLSEECNRCRQSVTGLVLSGVTFIIFFFPRSLHEYATIDLSVNVSINANLCCFDVALELKQTSTSYILSFIFGLL